MRANCSIKSRSRLVSPSAIGSSSRVENIVDFTINHNCVRFDLLHVGLVYADIKSASLCALLCTCSSCRRFDNWHNILSIARRRLPDGQDRSAPDHLHWWHARLGGPVALVVLHSGHQSPVLHIWHYVWSGRRFGLHTHACHTGPLLQALSGKG